MFKSTTIVLGIAASMALIGSAQAGPLFNLYGASVVIPNPGIPGEGNVLQVTSDPAGTGYGGMYYDATSSALTVGTLLNVSALYQMTEGTFGNGAPRFSLIDTTSNTNNEAYIYWGTPTGGGSFTDPHPGTWASTGNLASLASSDVRVYVNGFGGQNTPNTGETWAQFVAAQASTQIAYVSLDLDGGFTSAQQMITDEFTVNNAVYEAGPDAPEPGTLTLVCLGIAGLCGYSWRQRRKFAVA
jgi:PEP-CTERM motif